MRRVPGVGAALQREAERVRRLLNPHGPAALARAAPSLSPRSPDHRAASARVAAAAQGLAASVTTASPASAPEEAVLPMRAAASSMRLRLEAAREVLCAGLLERETEGRLLLLAAVCEDHLLLLGPPGVAKSELARRLAGLCASDASGPAPLYFERQLHRHTMTEELFGPLSLAALQSDRLERQTAGFLPDASVAFLDEIFKASSATCNALLSILNERTFEGSCARAQASQSLAAGGPDQAFPLLLI
jgi:MoxR-like ATPase